MKKLFISLVASLSLLGFSNALADISITDYEATYAKVVPTKLCLKNPDTRIDSAIFNDLKFVLVDRVMLKEFDPRVNNYMLFPAKLYLNPSTGTLLVAFMNVDNTLSCFYTELGIEVDKLIKNLQRVEELYELNPELFKKKDKVEEKQG